VPYEESDYKNRIPKEKYSEIKQHED